eukprot:PhM_4_TR6079/c0_g1_i1/m.2910
MRRVASDTAMFSSSPHTNIIVVLLDFTFVMPWCVMVRSTALRMGATRSYTSSSPSTSSCSWGCGASAKYRGWGMSVLSSLLFKSRTSVQCGDDMLSWGPRRNETNATVSIGYSHSIGASSSSSSSSSRLSAPPPCCCVLRTLRRWSLRVSACCSVPWWRTWEATNGGSIMFRPEYVLVACFPDGRRSSSMRFRASKPFRNIVSRPCAMTGVIKLEKIEIPEAISPLPKSALRTMGSRKFATRDKKNASARHERLIVWNKPRVVNVRHTTTTEWNSEGSTPHSPETIENNVETEKTVIIVTIKRTTRFPHTCRSALKTIVMPRETHNAMWSKLL